MPTTRSGSGTFGGALGALKAEVARPVPGEIGGAPEMLLHNNKLRTVVVSRVFRSGFHHKLKQACVASHTSWRGADRRAMTNADQGNGAQSSDPVSLDALVDSIAVSVRGGLSPEDAAKRLSMWESDERVRAALVEYRKLTGRIRSLRDPGAIVDDQMISWYMGPQDGDRFWPSLEKHLRAKGREDEGIRSLDASSSKVVSLLQPPGVAVKTRGLVIGYVQSGKTENFTAVISKAADIGYRFFIVLSGLNNALRDQTQDRLNKDIISLNLDEWITLTDARHDFKATTNVNAFLTDKQTLKILGVLKKNPTRLARLLKWLRSARPEVLQGCPVLVIDDEADQASPNSAKELADRTEINRLLVEILRTLPKAAYGGNVLSRGLTIEGLTVSFFVRSASAYDTLLQMGRWFGYRPGYADLPRLWMTQDLKSYFYHLAIVEREIRYDINKYKNGHTTPLQFGVRIRKHPFLAITSKLKMQKSVKAKMSFSGQAPQTLVFRHKDKGWLDSNMAAATRLIAGIQARGIQPSSFKRAIDGTRRSFMR